MQLCILLPSLIQNWNDKASVVKVKKAYSVLNQAYLMSKKDNGPVSEWNTGFLDHYEALFPLYQGY